MQGARHGRETVAAIPIGREDKQASHGFKQGGSLSDQWLQGDARTISHYIRYFLSSLSNVQALYFGGNPTLIYIEAPRKDSMAAYFSYSTLLNPNG